MSTRFSWQQVAPDLFAVIDTQRFPQWATNDTYSSARDAERVARELEEGRSTPSYSEDVPLTTTLPFTSTPVITERDGRFGRVYSEYPRPNGPPRRVVHRSDTPRYVGHVHAVRQARAEWCERPSTASATPASSPGTRKKDRWHDLRMDVVHAVLARVGAEKSNNIEWAEAWDAVVPVVLATETQRRWYRAATEDGNKGWQRYYFSRDLRARQKQLREVGREVDSMGEASRL